MSTNPQPCQEGARPLSPAEILLLDPATRACLWRSLIESLEEYVEGLRRRPIARPAPAEQVRAYVRGLDFERPVDPLETLRFVLEGFDRFHVHNAHPRYLGLFVPASSTMGVAADALAAAFNPVLAAWRLSPFAVEVERHLIARVAARFGFDPETSEGCFTCGGSEANHTALLVALSRAFPRWRSGGLRDLPGRPALYVSAEGHHSIAKAAVLCGLGAGAARPVAVDAELRLDAAALRRAIASDRAAGELPFLIVATAGTTSAGAVDPLAPLAEIARQEDLWLHADAAWGGAGVLLPELREAFAGIESADSITFDPHKWLSVPMAAGMFLTRHAGLLERTFQVDGPYMPPARGAGAPVDFYRSSMTWARRFTGLKLLMTLAVAGWRGYESIVRHQVVLGARLRERLAEAGFLVVNRTPLPVVCFVDALEGLADGALEEVAGRVVSEGRAWISTTRIGPLGSLVLRGAITSFHTTSEDVDAVVGTLADARRAVALARAGGRFRGPPARAADKEE